MNEVIEILKNNWQPIVAVLVLIVSFILQLIKKRPINDIWSDIYIAAVDAVKSAETIKVDGVKVSGEQKLKAALYMVSSTLQQAYPDIDVSLYKDIIIAAIENILSAPQKKGGSSDGK